MQRAGLHRLQRLDLAEALRLAVGEAAFGGEIEHLPADHAAQSGGARQRHHQFDAHVGARMGFRPRQKIEREGEQAVAGEDGGRFVELLVRGRPAAPQIVIVHRRQVVMHQRVAMHAFERRAGHQRARARHVEQGGRLDDQKRAKALAATEAHVAHRVEQPARARAFAVDRRRAEEPVEQRLGFGGDLVRRRQEEFSLLNVQPAFSWMERSPAWKMRPSIAYARPDSTQSGRA